MERLAQATNGPFAPTNTALIPYAPADLAWLLGEAARLEAILDRRCQATCPDCGKWAVFDEDGCCTVCGSDCEETHDAK